VSRPTGIARLSLLAAAVVMAAGAPAWGYVRKRTDGGIPEYWQVSCIPATIYTYGFGEMTRDQVAKSLAAAAHTWSPSAVTCPDGGSHPFLEIVLSMADEKDKPPLPAYDGHNTVLFFTPTFPAPETSPIKSGVVALTSVFARADGHIVDADVQVNASDFSWTNRDPGFVGPGNNQDYAYDLQNAVTHEFGHLLGLGHTCWAPFSDFDQPIDDMGAGVPLCSPVPVDSGVVDTVMFATIETNTEVSKRTLSADDIRAVCEIYPDESDPHACASDLPDDGCGCSAGRPRDVRPALVGLLLAAVALRARRRHEPPREG
jgi:MYXO-CTERM domain-containing protein